MASNTTSGIESVAGEPIDKAVSAAEKTPIAPETAAEPVAEAAAAAEPVAEAAAAAEPVAEAAAAAEPVAEAAIPAEPVNVPEPAVVNVEPIAASASTEIPQTYTYVPQAAPQNPYVNVNGQGQPSAAPNTNVPPVPGAPVYAAPTAAAKRSKDRVAAGVFGILLGGFGVHKFYLGYTAEAVIMLLVSILSFGLLYPVVQIIALIEGILYLCKTDEEFQAMYVQEKKGWF